MPISQGTARSTIILGVVQILLAVGAVVSGAVATSKSTYDALESIGLWALYYFLSGTLSIMAGYNKKLTSTAFALGANVVGVILAAVGIFLGGFYWIALDHFPDCYRDNYSSHECWCRDYDISCSDLTTVRNATGVATIALGLLFVACLTGSIFGCIGACCYERERTVVVGGAVPFQPSAVYFSNVANPLEAPPQYTAMQQGVTTAVPQVYPVTAPQQVFIGSNFQQGHATYIPQQDGAGAGSSSYNEQAGPPMTKKIPIE